MRTLGLETNFYGQHVVHHLTVEGVHSPEGRLWDVLWKHPHSDDEDLMMVNNVTVAEVNGAVTASLVIGTSWVRPQVSMPRYSMRAPGLTAKLLNRFDALDGEHVLASRATRLDAAGAEAFVEDLLLDPNRTRPVVFISDDPVSMKPLVDPQELAGQLAGMAHVYYSSHGYPGKRIADSLGSALSARNGAMRIWWPKLTRDSDPYEHRMYSGRALCDWRGSISPIETLFRVVSIASATNAAPPSYASLRRSARRAALAAASDVETYEQIANEAYEENDRLSEQLSAAEERASQALQERDEAREALDREREAKRLADKAYALSGANMPTATNADDEDEDEDLPEAIPSTVLEAVQQAQPRCPHLDFADRAFDSARDCPYEFPMDILEDLLLLERLAALWARPGGIGGMDLAAKASELGLTWRNSVSDITTGGTKARQYEFIWRGEKRKVGPHTRRDKGNGAGRIARIYLDKHEPEDPTERKLIVGIVGRKLEDSTTG